MYPTAPRQHWGQLLLTNPLPRLRHGVGSSQRCHLRTVGGMEQRKGPEGWPGGGRLSSDWT